MHALAITALAFVAVLFAINLTMFVRTIRASRDAK